MKNIIYAMPMKSSKEVVKHVPIEKLNAMIAAENNDKNKNRLKFIKLLYQGLSVPKAIEKIGKRPPTGYRWLKQWNDNGYSGLKMKYSPGRHTKLEDNEEGIKKIINSQLENKKNFDIGDLIQIINDKYKVDYSPRQMSRIVKKWGYLYWQRKIWNTKKL